MFRALLNCSFLFFFFVAPVLAQAQFAPPAGQEGSTAIHKDSTVFKAWGEKCSIQRGWQNISKRSMGKTSTGDSSACIAAADGIVCSLGDSGVAVYELTNPLYNGPGPDFAVFENAFDDGFLELAFVEVSNDGKNYVRFPAVSNTQNENQLESFGLLDARKIYNLAGKYRVNYGTPFNLDDLQDSSLNLDNIRFIKIIDVIGNVNEKFAVSYDSKGQKVNDPYPTEFPQGGFDLDAIGFINIKSNSINELAFNQVEIRQINGSLQLSSNEDLSINLFSLSGKRLWDGKLQANSEISRSNLSAGVYILHFSSVKGVESRKIYIRP